MTKPLFATFLALASLASAATRADMLVNTAWLADHTTDAKVVILHVAAARTNYDAGHIPGARFVALGDFATTKAGITNELPPDADLKKLFEGLGVSDDTRVVIVGDGNVLPATRAWFTLDYLGHGDKTALLDGGLDKWKAENRTLTKDAPTVTAGHLTVKAKPELVISMDAVKQMSANPATATLLDARGAADYTGEKGAHIPSAANVFWQQGQVSREDSSLKSEQELRKLYESAGIKPEKKVVTYCGSGMQASQSYFTLKYLGYDVALYDGSMTEWNSKGGETVK